MRVALCIIVRVTYRVVRFVPSFVLASRSRLVVKRYVQIGAREGNRCIDNDNSGCLVTLRFGDIVSGLASSLHPLLGFDQGPRLDTGNVRDASAGKRSHNLVGVRTWCLAYSTPQPRPPQRFRTCPHTKSSPTLLSDVSGQGLGAKDTRRVSVVRSPGRPERRGMETNLLSVEKTGGFVVVWCAVGC